MPALAAIRRAAGGELGAAPAPPPGLRSASRAAALALALAVLPTFVWGLFPPTGFDATTYHLPYVRAFVEAQRLVVVHCWRWPAPAPCTTWDGGSQGSGSG